MLIVGNSVHVSFEYMKPITDWNTKQGYGSPTWQQGETGIHGGSSNYILDKVRNYTDQFIDEYLRVNDGACKKK